MYVTTPNDSLAAQIRLMNLAAIASDAIPVPAYVPQIPHRNGMSKWLKMWWDFGRNKQP